MNKEEVSEKIQQAIQKLGLENTGKYAPKPNQGYRFPIKRKNAKDTLWIRVQNEIVVSLSGNKNKNDHKKIYQYIGRGYDREDSQSGEWYFDNFELVADVMNFYARLGVVLNMEQEFKKWLGNQHTQFDNSFTEGGIDRLALDLRVTIPNWIGKGTLFDIVDIDVIEKLHRRCLKGGDLFELNKKKANMHSSNALKKYKEFLRQRRSVEDIVTTQKFSIETDTPLNQILYGPPGTGKTYSTVEYALKILGAEDRKGDIKSIRQLKEAFGSQVEFVTFHQSFSYEDFVEGLKANSDGNNITYDIESGIFKLICKNAKNSGNDSLEELNKAIGKLKEQVEEKPLKLETLVHQKPYILTYKGNKAFYAKPDAGKYSNPVSIDSIVKLYKNPEIKSGDNGVHFKIYTLPVIKHLKEKFGLSDYQATANKKPHVLIIDEINRGNISRIFGELITLIEPSKRAGANEEISVQLPYSKEPFSVPNNLYIIGTMNTADRSLALMDTALRRRFDFTEMMPDLKLVKGKFDGIEVKKILESINQRIEILYDREHTIGHSFLMKVDNIEDLRKAFKNNILPLLEEYFYDDFAKIKLVLNDTKDDGYFYKKDNPQLFADDSLNKEIYHKQDISKLATSAFTQIYLQKPDVE